jgi:hypothetical protein
MGVGDSPAAQEIPNDILGDSERGMSVTLEDVKASNPRTLGIIELRTGRDLTVFRNIHAHSSRLGTALWKIVYSCEFHMTNDSKLFPPLDWWRSQGYRPDAFGRWIGLADEVAIPFFEGRMIGQHDCSQKGWVSGKGRTALWRSIQFDKKQFEPQYLMPVETLHSWQKANLGIKVALMDITSSTNTRSMIATATSYFPFGHSAPVLNVADGDLAKTLCLASILNSLAFDFAARPRVSGVHLTWSILEECPVPQMLDDSTIVIGLGVRSARLCLIHRRFAQEWLKLKSLYPSLTNQEWKAWWAVTEADRLRLRVEIDALCADLYGLEPDDFDWAVRDDRSDPKSFYRVDRELPFRERLTGLSGAAFRALKEGLWSAESAANLSNDEFFEILGIPELTDAEAAKAKGLPGPLILRRGGCHIWKPEDFPPDDPRYGWTWDDCWRDAVSLLGSEGAVCEAVQGSKTSQSLQDREQDSGSFELRRGGSQNQGRLF